LRTQNTAAYAAIGAITFASIIKQRQYPLMRQFATQLWFSGLTVGRIVQRKTLIINFIQRCNKNLTPPIEHFKT
jgi:hypothetical protein